MQDQKHHSHHNHNMNVAALPTLDGGTDPTMVDQRPFGPAPAASCPIAPAARQPDVRTTILPSIERHGDVPVMVQLRHPRYQELRQLGEGGAGEVALVRDNDIHRQVALKRLRAVHSHSPDALVRFIEEIRTVSQLDHPGIVPIHDVGIDEHGRYYFIMKYAQGETLEAVLDKLAAGDPAYLARYPIERRVQIFIQVLRAMEFAHARDLIHRDIKPANIMLGAYGEVMVMDWGLAKQVVHDQAAPAAAAPVPAAVPAATDGPPEPRERLFTTQHGALLGTPAYMSPEQASGDNARLDQRSDIYSLCVLLHELLTLRHYLAHQKTLTGMLYGCVCEVPQFQLGDGLPPELMYFLQRGMQKDPKQRFASVTEMLARLHAIEEGRIHVQCPFTGMRRSSQEFMRLVNRRPFLALSLAGSTAALALYGGASVLGRLLHLFM